jgi:two-component system CheB/CheR fusion protein
MAHGKVDLRFQAVDLASAIRSACEDLSPAIDGAGLALDLGIAVESAWVRADPVRLAQVLGNLLSNAIKFSDRGGFVRVRLQLAGPHAVVRVEDGGIGIEPELLERMFQPFQQGTSRRGGLGLGLALVRGLVELHGGEVEVGSDGPGRGARFTVRLPLHLPA